MRWTWGFLALASLSSCSCSRPSAPPAPPPPAPAPIAPPVAPVAPPVAPVAPPEDDAKGVLLELGGVVEVKRAGSNDWVAMSLGEPVRVGDSVRTRSDGSVTLTLGAVKVTLQDGSSFTLEVLKPHEVRGKVQGAAHAVVPEGLSFVLGGEGSDAKAQSEGGEFTMSVDERGVVVVGAQQGKVALAGGGGHVELSIGEISRIVRGAPEKPRKAAREVALSVNWPADEETNRKVLPLDGKADLGSRVRVQGRSVSLSSAGTFTANVPLRAGKQEISVAVVDVMGRRKVLTHAIVMDPNAPDISGHAEFH